MTQITPVAISITPVPASRMYALNRSIRAVINGTTLQIPFGFRTDGASIPRFAWVTTGTPFAPRHIRAAIIHDYLYQYEVVDRAQADRWFRFLLLEDGVSPYQAAKMYWALRAFGWIVWRRYRSESGPRR